MPQLLNLSLGFRVQGSIPHTGSTKQAGVVCTPNLLSYVMICHGKMCHRPYDVWSHHPEAVLQWPSQPRTGLEFYMLCLVDEAHYPALMKPKHKACCAGWWQEHRSTKENRNKRTTQVRLPHKVTRLKQSNTPGSNPISLLNETRKDQIKRRHWHP